MKPRRLNTENANQSQPEAEKEMRWHLVRMQMVQPFARDRGNEKDGRCSEHAATRSHGKGRQYQHQRNQAGFNQVSDAKALNKRRKSEEQD